MDGFIDKVTSKQNFEQWAISQLQEGGCFKEKKQDNIIVREGSKHKCLPLSESSLYATSFLGKTFIRICFC